MENKSQTKSMCPVCLEDKTLQPIACQTFTKCCKECWANVCKNNEAQDFQDSCPMCAKCSYRMYPITYFT